MTAMLGAQTEQLATLANRLTTTGSEIDQCQVEAQTTADTVVSQMEDSFHQALGGIESAMGNLRATVIAANGQLAETNWTGANADRFHDGYMNFDSAMGDFENAVKEAYVEFDGQMKIMGQAINTFQDQVTASMKQAHESTDSMQLAVSQQRDNLDQAMNTGLTFS